MRILKKIIHCVWLHYRKEAINSLCFPHECSPRAAGESSCSSFHTNVTFLTQPMVPHEHHCNFGHSEIPTEGAVQVLDGSSPALYFQFSGVLGLASLWPVLCASGIEEKESFCWGYNVLLGLCLNNFNMRAVPTLQFHEQTMQCIFIVLSLVLKNK